MRAPILRCGVVLLVAAVLAACGGSEATPPSQPTPTPASVASLEISPATLTLTVGQTATLTAQPRDSAGHALTGRTVTWTSSSAVVASVSATGLVTAVGAGTSVIAATCEGITVSATVTVMLPPVASVKLTPSAVALLVGQSDTLQAQALDPSGNVLTGRSATWSSANTTVATVSASGVALGVGVGTTVITVTIEGKSATAAVTVTTPPPSVTVGSWTSMGPRNIPDQSGRVASGKLQALAISSSDPNVMYAGGGYGSGGEGPVTASGALKTTDGGAHWTAINSGLTDAIVNVLWVDPTNANVVLAGTNFSGIFRTNNGGQSWTNVAALGTISDFAMQPGRILAATASGVAQSVDDGITWTIARATSSVVRALAAGGGAVVAGLNDGTLMVQSSPTANWQSVQSGAEVASVAVDSTTPTTAYAVIGCCAGRLVATTNGGQSWSALSPPAGPQAVATSAAHSVLIAGGGFLYRSVDAGQSWYQIPNAQWDNRRIFTVAGSNTIILGSDQGLHLTSNLGGSWSDISASVSNSILTGIAVHGSTMLTAVQDFSPILSFDGATTWQQPLWTSGNAPVGEDGAVAINPANPSYCYAYTTAGYQYSNDGCRTFHYTSAPGLSGGVTYAQPGLPGIIAVDPSAPSTVYAASQGGVYRSTDWGVTMNATGWPIQQSAMVAVDPSDSKTIYAGSQQQLYKTTDGGATWSVLSLGTNSWLGSIAIDPKAPKTILVGLAWGAGNNGGILRSTDGGATFRAANTGLSTNRIDYVCWGVNVPAIAFDASGVAAAATCTGMYVSADVGDHWQNITGNSVSSLFYDVAWDGGFLYAATFGQGVLRAPVTITNPAPNKLLRRPGRARTPAPAPRRA